MAKGSSLVITEFDDFMKQLQALGPQFKKDFDKGLRQAVLPMAKLAQAFVPNDISYNSRYVFSPQEPTYQSAAWIDDTEHRSRDSQRWTWRPGEVRKGIVVRRKSTRRVPVGYSKVAVSVLSLINSTASGAIYELAGSGKRRRGTNRSRNPNAREDFLTFFPKVAGRPKRLIYRAEAQTGDKVREELVKVIDQRLLKFVRS